MLGNLRRYDAKLVPWDTVDTSKRFATRRGEEGLKRELVALRGDKPERLMRVVVWQPSLAVTPTVGHSGYIHALRNTPWRRRFKAVFASHRLGCRVASTTRAFAPSHLAGEVWGRGNLASVHQQRVASLWERTLARAPDDAVSTRRRGRAQGALLQLPRHQKKGAVFTAPLIHFPRRGGLPPPPPCGRGLPPPPPCFLKPPPGRKPPP